MNHQNRRFAYLLLVPSVCLILVFQYLPMYGLSIAFREFAWSTPLTAPLVGFANFHRLMRDPAFSQTLVNTLIYAAVGGALVAILGIAIAGTFHLKSLFARRPQFNSLLLAPSFISWVVVSVSVPRLFSSRGLINSLLVESGLTSTAVPFLTTAAPFQLLFVISTVWKHAGLMAFIAWTLLQQGKPEIRESAELDGLSSVGAFFRVELPILRVPVTTLALFFVLVLFDAFGEQALSLGNAAIRSHADVLESYVYRLGIQRGRWGMASAGAVVAAALRAPIAIALILVGVHARREQW